MSLLKKLSVLAGALVHRPPAPRREKVDLDEAGEAPVPRRQDDERRERTDLETREPGLVDTDRVADLIAKKKEEGQG